MRSLGLQPTQPGPAGCGAARSAAGAGRAKGAAAGHRGLGEPLRGLARAGAGARIKPCVVVVFSPTAESFGVSAQIGSGVVRGGPQVRFHEGSTRVPPWFHEGSTRFCEGCGGASAKKRHRMLLGMSPELFFKRESKGGGSEDGNQRKATGGGLLCLERTGSQIDSGQLCRWIVPCFARGLMSED